MTAAGEPVGGEPPAEDDVEGSEKLKFRRAYPADRLVKLDLPTMELEKHQPRVIEIHDNVKDEWNRATITRMSADGSVELLMHESGETERLVDLSEERYRWVLENPVQGESSGARG